MTSLRLFLAAISFFLFAAQGFAGPTDLPSAERKGTPSLRAKTSRGQGNTALLTPEQKAWVAKARRLDRAGWTYLHTEGEPRERGFQHGFLLASEIGEGLRITRIEWEHETAMDWTWLLARASAMFVPKIDPENLEELEGIAEGARAGGANVSRDDIIT